MSVIVSGLMHVYGPPGSGKTTFALTASDDPTKIVFLDGDASKGKYLADQLKLKHYYDLTRVGLNHETELEYHEAILALVEALPDNMDLIVWDIADEMFKGAHTYVHTHRMSFRKNWAPLGAIAGAQEWIEMRKSHLPRLYSKLMEKAKLVIFLSHEKAQTDDTGIKTGLSEPDSDKTLETKSALRIRLARNMRNPEDPAPIGLVTKNTIGIIEPKTRKITSVFPLRIAPCTWDKIAEYLESPVGARKPTKDEIPDEREFALISGVLTDEQQSQYDYYRRVQLRQMDTEMTQAVVEQAEQYGNKIGIMPLTAKILSELEDQYPELTKDRIKDIVTNLRAESKESEDG